MKLYGKDLIEQIRSIGLLSHLTDAEISRLAETKNSQDDELELISLLGQTGSYLDVSDLTGTAAGDYKNLFESLSKIAHGKFPITSIRVQSTESESVLQFRLDDSLYENRFYPSLTVRESAVYMLAAANRAIADHGSQDRFYGVLVPADKISPSTPYHHFHGIDNVQAGIVYLTEPQKTAIESHLALVPGRYSYEIWTTQRIKDFITFLREIGIFGDLSEQEVEDGTNKTLRETDGGAPFLVFDQFENTALWFDTEMYDSPDNYRELLLEAMSISNGEFQLEDIQTLLDEAKANIVVSFKVNSGLYKGSLPVHHDWIDLGYLALLNTALAESKCIKRYFIIDRDVQDVIILFLTQNQADSINNSGYFKVSIV